MKRQKGSALVIVLCVVIVLALVVLGGAMFLNYKASQNIVGLPIQQNPQEAIEASSPVSTEVLPEIEEKVVASVAVTTDLWSLFDKLKEALKNKDFKSFNDFSYEKMPISESGQFSEFATFFYGEVSKLNKADFVNKWQDDKQAIYSTNPVKKEISGSASYSQDQISFIKDGDSWKILKISSSVGTEKMIDSDKDGLTDDDENCAKSRAVDPRCVKTDPNNRDSNGNGWWDGVEAGMK
jgi:flagellar basal body-associated protein FliL